MGKASKRQRRSENNHSLRVKSVQQQESALDLLLSDELKEQLAGSGGNEQLLILPSKKQKQGDTADKQDTDAQQPEEQLSKSQLRKLRQIQQKKERRENIAQVVQQLNSSSASDAHLAMLRPLHQRGAKETKKQRLRRMLLLERAGVTLSKEDAEQLYKPRRQQGDIQQEIDSDEELGPGQPMSASQQIPQQPQAAQLPATLASQAQQGDDDGGDVQQGSYGGDVMIDSGSSGSGSDDEMGDVDDMQLKKQQQEALREAVKKARQEAGATGLTEEDPEDAAERVALQRQAAAAASEAAAIQAAGGSNAFKHRVVHVTRHQDVQSVRQGLPIIAMEQEIVEAVAANDVVMLDGETGCGKTTQVPQFLLEAGYGCAAFPERAGCIGVTQPRRVAATSTAERVAYELGSELGSTVGYQIRYDRQVGSGTRIKFMTDGILLRELQEDFLLRRYSVLLVDEAHERSLNTDLLLGMLAKAVDLRRKLCNQQRAAQGYNPESPDAVHPLKLIIMSATLKEEDFVKNHTLFKKPPPIVKVPARQFPVTVHFSRHTEQVDYVGAAFRKVCRIHRELPPGGVLVFLTGQREVEHMCRRLRDHFARAAGRSARAAALLNGRATDRDSMVGDGGATDASEQRQEDPGGIDEWFGSGDQAEARTVVEESNQTNAPLDEVDDFDYMNDERDEDEEEVIVMGGDGLTPEDIAEAEKRFEEQLGFKKPSLQPLQPNADSNAQQEQSGPGPVHVLPLYAMLPAHLQARVFQPAPEGHRLIIVATNVAETSLTIPGIRYVVDAGRSKQRLLEGESGGMARFEVRWVSQSSAKQRAGRAGRTGPGHCYRLYSSAHYNDSMPQHTPPEIVNTSLEGVVLMLKSMHIDKVTNFPFPTHPGEAALEAAERCLIALCALEPKTRKLTDVGKAMAAFPIGPRHARMLLEVAAWQLKLEGAAIDRAKAAGSRPHPYAAQSLPYAVALAAALTVDSPFMHSDAAANDKAEQQQDSSKSNADNAARHAHRRLRCSESDALSALRALCAYEAADNPSAFAAANHLHARSLQEAAELHRQLIRILATCPAASQQSDSAEPAQNVTIAQQLARLAAGSTDSWLSVIQKNKTGDLPSSVQECLRRALAVGWADCIAKKREQPGSKKRAVPYISCALANANEQGVDSVKAVAQLVKGERHGVTEDLSGDVYLHPRSALRSQAPDLLMYTELVRRSEKVYMSGATNIQADWLMHSGTPLAQWSAPSQDKLPCYQGPPVDKVLAWHGATYGNRHEWAIGPCLRPHADVKVAARYFAEALLEGRPVPVIKDLRPLLISPPSVASKPENQGIQRVGELVGALERNQVTNLATLVEKWAKNPSFLLQELKAWVQAPQRPQVDKLWPTMIQQASEALKQQVQAQAQVQQRVPKQSVMDMKLQGHKQRKRAAMQVDRSATELVAQQNRKKKMKQKQQP